jgi:hypothetical protein
MFPFRFLTSVIEIQYSLQFHGIVELTRGCNYHCLCSVIELGPTRHKERRTNDAWWQQGDKPAGSCYGVCSSDDRSLRNYNARLRDTSVDPDLSRVNTYGRRPTPWTDVEIGFCPGSRGPREESQDRFWRCVSIYSPRVAATAAASPVVVRSTAEGRHRSTWRSRPHVAQGVSANYHALILVVHNTASAECGWQLFFRRKSQSCTVCLAFAKD